MGCFEISAMFYIYKKKYLVYLAGSREKSARVEFDVLDSKSKLIGTNRKIQ